MGTRGKGFPAGELAGSGALLRGEEGGVGMSKCMMWESGGFAREMW